MSQSTPYIGSRIRLTSEQEIRYEGILYTINTQESTIALQSVRCFGTEGRRSPEIPPSSEVYDFIIFRGQDIKDLTVLEAWSPALSAKMNDPAILSINQKPSVAAAPTAPERKGGQTAASRSHSGKSSGWSADRGRWASGTWSEAWDSYGGGWSAHDYAWDRGGAIRKGGIFPLQGRHCGFAALEPTGKRSKGSKDGIKGSGKCNKTCGEKSYSKGGRRAGDGAPVGELLPEDNAQAKKEFAEEFNIPDSNHKFNKVSTIEGVEGLEEKMKPLAGYNKAKSFFDSISCGATERACEVERQKIDRDKLRQFDKETFGNTRRPPRPAGGRRGKGRR